MDSMTEIFGEVIYAYTRAQAIEDGVLVDVTQTAREAGFRLPVAVTSAVWSNLIQPSEALAGWGQSVQGRLWDVLFLLHWQIKVHPEAQSELRFKVIFLIERRGREPKHETVTLKALIGPGDAGEPVITIMYPEED